MRARVFLTRKHLSRRTLLRGAGAAIALPWLDAMQPAMAAAKPVPQRLAFVYIPNGAIMQDWTPRMIGSGFDLPRILQPLAPVRDSVMVLSGLDHHNALALGDGGGDHARAGACFLTGAHPKKSAGADIANGISADQVVARLFDGVTRFPSLELGCESAVTVGDCDSGYSCAYTNSISWRGPASPMPPEVNPRLVFERLFGSEDLSLDPAARARRAAYRKSILDMAQEDAHGLEKDLGPADRRKLDEYLYAIREIEQRVEAGESQQRQYAPGLEKPTGIPFYYSEHLKLLYDLQVAAFQGDLTRVTTTMAGRESSSLVYSEIGLTEQHHTLTHHRGDAMLIDKVRKINTFHMELFAYFLGKLQAVKEGDSTLLDRSMIVYGSAIADGDTHSHLNLPVLLAGRGGGWQSGRHLQYRQGTPMTNLYVALLDRMGAHTAALGDSNSVAEL